MGKKHWVWLILGFGVLTQVPAMFVEGSSAPKASAEPASAKAAIMSSEEHARAVNPVASSKPKPEVAAVSLASLPPMDNADHMIGAIINLNGFLCARPVLVQETEAPNLYAVQCITHRDGTGLSNYLVDSRTNKVTRI